MTAWERCAVWNRHCRRDATFKFVSDDSDADIWLVDMETGEQTLLSGDDCRILALVFEGVKP